MNEDKARINIRNPIVRQHMHVCEKMVKRYKNIPREDVLQDCYELTIMLAEKYLRNEMSEPFEDYIIPWLRKCIPIFAKKYKSGFTDSLDDTDLPDEEPPVSEAQYSKILEESKRVLTKEEFDLITGTTKVKYLSDLKGYSVQYARRIREKANKKLNKLKKQIGL